MRVFTATPNIIKQEAARHNVAISIVSELYTQATNLPHFWSLVKQAAS